jgi:hypothetical protein
MDFDFRVEGKIIVKFYIPRGIFNDIEAGNNTEPKLLEGFCKINENSNQNKSIVLEIIVKKLHKNEDKTSIIGAISNQDERILSEKLKTDSENNKIRFNLKIFHQKNTIEFLLFNNGCLVDRSKLNIILLTYDDKILIQSKDSNELSQNKIQKIKDIVDENLKQYFKFIF